MKKSSLVHWTMVWRLKSISRLRPLTALWRPMTSKTGKITSSGPNAVREAFLWQTEAFHGLRLGWMMIGDFSWGKSVLVRRAQVWYNAGSEIRKHSGAGRETT